MENLNVNTKTSASVSSGNEAIDGLAPKGRFVARLFDKNGNLKWEDDFNNVVTDLGAKAMLDTYLAGSGYTAAFYMGLISSVSYASAPVAADTAASHTGWTEAGGTNAPTYSASTRPAVTWNSAAGSGTGARTKTLQAVSFTFTASGTVKGSFLITNSAKDGTTGTLFSAGLFSGGDRAVASGDVLQVSYQLTL